MGTNFLPQASRFKFLSTPTPRHQQATFPMSSHYDMAPSTTCERNSESPAQYAQSNIPRTLPSYPAFMPLSSYSDCINQNGLSGQNTYLASPDTPNGSPMLSNSTDQPSPLWPRSCSEISSSPISSPYTCPPSIGDPICAGEDAFSRDLAFQSRIPGTPDSIPYSEPRRPLQSLTEEEWKALPQTSFPPHTDPSGCEYGIGQSDPTSYEFQDSGNYQLTSGPYSCEPHLFSRQHPPQSPAMSDLSMTAAGSSISPSVMLNYDPLSIHLTHEEDSYASSLTSIRSEAEMGEPEPQQPHQQQEEDDGNDQPYNQLIEMALRSQPNFEMRLQDIYKWIKDNTNKAKGSTNGWQNSVRHNLSMNAAFEKVLDPLHAPRTGGGSKKAPVWRLTQRAVEEGVKSTTRYRKNCANKNARRSDNPAPQRQRSGARGGKAAKKANLRRSGRVEERFALRGEMGDGLGESFGQHQHQQLRSESYEQLFSLPPSSEQAIQHQHHHHHMHAPPPGPPSGPAPPQTLYTPPHHITFSGLPSEPILLNEDATAARHAHRQLHHHHLANMPTLNTTTSSLNPNPFDDIAGIVPSSNEPLFASNVAFDHPGSLHYMAA
ncbi:MAG: hypothetical protein M1834_007691 [Cirrosporium novae-zelandiae]|nr:MAG: hypothetical protein M1834_007691 [Cirrosporium novae-zelandiae]